MRYTCRESTNFHECLYINYFWIVVKKKFTTLQYCKENDSLIISIETISPHFQK
jgi:hypothetical protein